MTLRCVWPLTWAGSSLQVHAVRFGPGQELLGSLQAPFVLTCVGSVTKAMPRLANATATNANQVAESERGLPR